MKLAMQDVTRMFDVPEATIERWIRDDELPHHRVQGQIRFHRADLLEWANQRRIRLASDPPASVHRSRSGPMLSDALAAGGIHYSVPASDRESLLRAVVDRMPLEDEGDRELLFDVMLARENAGSTGVGDGIAIPHVRNPVVLPVDHAMITLCFLAKPIDFDAIDDKPVHTVFALVAPTIRVHLFLLGRLSAVLHDEAFHRALIERAKPEVLLDLARDAEERFSGGRRSWMGGELRGNLEPDPES
jgi:PTS system nitrogen regulatory IIA component